MGNRYGGDGSGGEYDGRQPDAAEQYVLETFERGEPTGSAAGGAARGRSRGPSPSPSAASRATDDGRVVADGAGVDSYDDLYESVERTVEAAEGFGLSDGDVEAVKEEVRRLERRGMDPEAASERVDELVQYEETDPIGSLGRPDLGPNAPDELRFGDAKRAVNLGAESTGSSHRTDRIWRVESNDGTVYVQDCSDGDAETGMLVSEGIGGVSGKDLYDARSAPGAYGDKVPGDPDAIEVDREAYLEAAATSVLTGDGDWSIDNVVLRDEDVTEPVPIDSDFAGEHTIKEIEYRAVNAIGTRTGRRAERSRRDSRADTGGGPVGSDGVGRDATGVRAGRPGPGEHDGTQRRDGPKR
ncbi:hypothetical protein BRD17_01790 [Halobacteriales archaeon SW_7_68_16]|nr:MAG: hypothetical protein BRD17_01790 [Halobacteriales archaeon SW_7_68_16]